MIPFASLMMVVAEMQSPRKRTINLTLSMPISIIVGVTNSVTMAKVEALTSNLKKRDSSCDEDFSALSLIKNPINHQIVLQIDNSIVREGSLRERVFDKLRNILAAKFVQLDAKSIT